MGDTCRGAATDSIALAVCYGMFPREEALSFLHTFLVDEVAAENGYVTTLAAGCICDIGPGESMELITSAFEKGLRRRHQSQPADADYGN